MSGEVHFTLNGRPTKANVRPDDTLVELLNRLGLFGAKESCGQGICGSCTVLVDSVAVSSCLHLASLVDGADVDTIEGLTASGVLHPVQAAFVEAGAFQCGFCTPGFIMMAIKLLENNTDPTDSEIKHYL